MAGLFSAQRTDHPVVMAEVAAEVTRLGGRVVESFVQRRGVSGGKKGKNTPGGAVTMSEPYSSRTLMSMGKVREIAEACHRANAGAVVFANELTGRQRAALATICGCPVFGHDDLVSPIRSAHDDSPP
ncbi:hypothetical protein [Nocardia sp. NBC_00416]|uniref:HflX-like GTP-binding protein n=1 Tax=Nocardia sp. NBC_00416 TaxID=2975991 RepID=UPI002E218E22